MAPILILSLVFTVALVLVVGRMLWRLLGPIRVILLEHQRGVLYRNGRLSEVLTPGIYWSTARRQIVPVDVRKQLHQVPGQEILTSDGIAVKVSAALEYAITDPMTWHSSTSRCSHGITGGCWAITLHMVSRIAILPVLSRR